jgi:hypothetical protein
MGLLNLLKPGGCVVVVDGVSLNENLGMKGKVPPRNQLQLLRKLAGFGQREKLDVAVVLSGTPLHKAPPKKKFENINVFYSSSPEAHAQYTVKVARSKGSGAVLVSDNASVDKIAGRGMKTMRMSTFRKAFDAGGNEVESFEQSGRSGRGRSGRRRQQKKGGEKNAEAAPKEPSPSDAINELIDLID